MGRTNAPMSMASRRSRQARLRGAWQLAPGAERLGPFEVEAQAYGGENRVVLATARRAP